MKIHIYLFSRIGGLVIFLTICAAGANAQWVKINTPPIYTALCFATIDTNLFAGVSYIGGGLLFSTDNGTNWTAVVNKGFPGTSVYSLAISGTNLFAGTGYGVFFSSDSGTNWITAGTRLGTIPTRTLAVSGTNLFAGTDSGAYRSTDNGTNWTYVNSGVPGVRCFGVSGTNIFAGTDDGVFLSTNNGTTWVQSGLANIAIEAFAVSGTNIFAGTIKDVFLSTDNGTTWKASNTRMADTIVLSLTTFGPNIFAGTLGGGVFLSTNNGRNWTNVSTGMTDSNITPLAVSGSYLFAGAYDHSGIWRRPLSEMINPNSVTPEILSSFTLEQNTPNPFSTTTTIHYSIPNHEHVKITLSNMLGQKLATKLDIDVEAGSHDLMISVNDLPSGIYVVTMNAGGISKSEKICIMR